MSDGKTSSLAKLTQKGIKLIAYSAASHVVTKGTIAGKDKARCARMERYFIHVGTIGTGTIGTITGKDKARCARMERYFIHVGMIGTGTIGTIAGKDKARCARKERYFVHVGTIRTGTIGTKLTTKMNFLCSKLE